MPASYTYSSQSSQKNPFSYFLVLGMEPRPQGVLSKALPQSHILSLLENFFL
jgi:hypothetical protein